MIIGNKLGIFRDNGKENPNYFILGYIGFRFGGFWGFGV